MERNSGLKKQVLSLVEFSVGQVKDGMQLDFKRYKSNQGTDGKRKLVCNTSHIQYSGSNFDYDPSRPYLKHYLVAVDRNTGKKRIFPTETYKLNPVVKREKDIDSDLEEQQAMEKALNETRTFHERLDHLTEVFGSKIKKKAMASRQRNKVSDTAEVIKSSVQTVVDQEGITGGAAVDEHSLSILPYNKEATSEDQVYELELFIPTHIRLAAADAAQELIQPSADKIKMWKEEKNPLGSRYIAWRARHTHPSVSNDEDTFEEYLNCLQILAYFMKVYAPLGTTAEKGKYLEGMSQTIKSWIISEFGLGEKSLSLKRRLPTPVKDKILSYAVVLAWHIDSCQFDIQMLAEGFAISEKKLSMVVRALGGKTKIAQQEGIKRTMGILQLPLEFPKEGGGRRRGR